MKPHPRIRRTIKWGGAALTVLLVGVWVGSGWWSVGWFGLETRGFWIGAGTAFVNFDGLRRGDFVVIHEDGPDPGWFAERVPLQFQWHFAHSSFVYEHHVEVPLWAPVTLVGLVTAVAWRLDTLARRRARQNLCPTCHYPRIGLAPGAVCPECGSAPAPVNP